MKTHKALKHEGVKLSTIVKRKECMCGICGRICSSQAALRSHEMIHTGEKPFKCEHCDKCFAQSSSLKIHSETHNTEKNYSCEKGYFIYC